MNGVIITTLRHHIYVGTITIPNTGTAAVLNNKGEKVIFKNCARFTKCMSRVNNAKIDNAKYIDVVISMYNLIKCSDIYWKSARSLWHYYREETALSNACNFINFLANNISIS